MSVHLNNTSKTRVSRRWTIISLLLVAAFFPLFAGEETSALAAGPKVSASCRGGSHTSILLEGGVDPEDLRTSWSFSSSITMGGPSWTLVPGGEGVITQTGAEKLGEDEYLTVQAELTGLAHESTYYALLAATSSSGSASEEAISFETGKPGCKTIPLYTSPLAIEVSNVTATSAQVVDGIDPNQNASVISWNYEIATAETGPWSRVLGAEGTISKADAEAAPSQGPFPSVKGELSDLRSGMTYYVRLSAEDEPEVGLHDQSTSPVAHLETSGQPAAQTFSTHALHGEDIRVLGAVQPNNDGLNAIQIVAVGGSPSGGTFTLTLPGQANAATGTGTLTSGSMTVSSVTTSTGLYGIGEPIAGVGIPAGTTIVGFDVGNHALTLSQAANRSSTSVALTAGLPEMPFNATATEVRNALEKLSSVGNNVMVSGEAGGPYKIEFVGRKASTKVPLLVGDGSGLTPTNNITVTSEREGFNYPTHYHFEYVNQAKFEESGFVDAVSTPEVLVAGISDVVVGEDLVNLRSGEAYHYRIAATNTTPGNPVVDGAIHTLTMPVISGSSVGDGAGGCPNEQLRTGLSAKLADCRAYEQVTPIDKEGAQEVFHYGVTLRGSGALVGEDGEHVMVGAPETKFGSNADSGQGPYFFTRSGSGWKMVAASTQPETGIELDAPWMLFTPDLTKFAFGTYWKTSNSSESPNDELKQGPPGGPYAIVASVPRKKEQIGEGWVAASEDFSELFLQVIDNNLLGRTTGTATTGEDIYEYAGGHLDQVNILAGGVPIGMCGARMASGQGEAHHIGGGGSSRHAVSTDGSRVFFEAVPGSECSAPDHLYMREAKTDVTLDIGTYTFVAANGPGNRLLLERTVDQEREFFLYDTENGAIRMIFSGGAGSTVAVAEDFTAIYFTAEGDQTPDAPPVASESFEAADIYRYDVASGTLSFLLEGTGLAGGTVYGGASPDGRYFYFAANTILGVPGGKGERAQVYRYDNTEDAIECMSCASPTDPEPGLAASFAGFGVSSGIFVNGVQGTPETRSFSADGDYAFFDTPAALVPQDVDGELEPTNDAGEYGGSYSPSSDVYEWRRAGLNGCTQLQGCLSLISSGLGGFRVLLLGTADEGRDVFFSDFSKLVLTDNDTAGDIYDARIGGGLPISVNGTECEGDACSTPASAPIDVTPSSFTFTGPGNVTQPRIPPAKTKKKAAKKNSSKCVEGKKLVHGKCVKVKAKSKNVTRSKSKMGGKR